MDVNKSVTADSFGIDKDLVLEFLVAFSRFEYALKRAGFATGDESQVSADWGSFGMRLRTLSPEQCAPVFQRCQYLQGQPPKKWVLRDGMLRLSDARDASL